MAGALKAVERKTVEINAIRAVAIRAVEINTPCFGQCAGHSAKLTGSMRVCASSSLLL